MGLLIAASVGLALWLSHRNSDAVVLREAVDKIFQARSIDGTTYDIKISGYDEGELRTIKAKMTFDHLALSDANDISMDYSAEVDLGSMTVAIKAHVVYAHDSNLYVKVDGLRDFMSLVQASGATDTNPYAIYIEAISDQWVRFNLPSILNKVAPGLGDKVQVMYQCVTDSYPHGTFFTEEREVLESSQLFAAKRTGERTTVDGRDAPAWAYTVSIDTGKLDNLFDSYRSSSDSRLVKQMKCLDDYLAYAETLATTEEQKQRIAGVFDFSGLDDIELDFTMLIDKQSRDIVKLTYTNQNYLLEQTLNADGEYEPNYGTLTLNFYPKLSRQPMSSDVVIPSQYQDIEALMEQNGLSIPALQQ